MRQQLQASQLCIHLPLDSWTSGNHLPILGVIGHTIVGDQLHGLALREIRGRHTGENVARMVLDIIQDYGITHKLGYIQMDNAANNDALMAALSSGVSGPVVIVVLLPILFTSTSLRL